MFYFSHIPSFLIWWYTQGLKRIFEDLEALFLYLLNFFSIKNLFKTLFAPWKRLVGVRRPGIDGFKDWILDNAVSRGVGFVMRLVLIMSGIIFLSVYFILALLFLALWILWPFLLVMTIFWTIAGD